MGIEGKEAISSTSQFHYAAIRVQNHAIIWPCRALQRHRPKQKWGQLTGSVDAERPGYLIKPAGLRQHELITRLIAGRTHGSRPDPSLRPTPSF